MKTLLTIKELSEYLKVSRKTIYNMMDDGLPYLMVGKTRRFDIEEIMEHFKNKGR